MTKHKCTWQLSEDGAAICLECTTIIGADGLIESLQEEIAALRAKVSEQDREYASVVNQFHDSLKRNTALEKVAEAAPELERVKYAWALYCGRGSKWEDAWREAGYLKEDGDE